MSSSARGDHRTRLVAKGSNLPRTHAYVAKSADSSLLGSRPVEAIKRRELNKSGFASKFISPIRREPTQPWLSVSSQSKSRFALTLLLGVFPKLLPIFLLPVPSSLLHQKTLQLHLSLFPLVISSHTKSMSQMLNFLSAVIHISLNVHFSRLIYRPFPGVVHSALSASSFQVAC